MDSRFRGWTHRQVADQARTYAQRARPREQQAQPKARGKASPAEIASQPPGRYDEEELMRRARRDPNGYADAPYRGWRNREVADFIEERSRTRGYGGQREEYDRREEYRRPSGGGSRRDDRGTGSRDRRRDDRREAG